ncbi:MAG TPA: DUF3810 domain-containing protein [Puia sp.]|nr:DUF3810 domain-containing protein [Puia sp.]
MPIRRKITWAGVILLAAAIKVFSYFPSAVEQYYSKGFYPVIARLQRILFGWVPFSIGDVLYLAVIVLLLYRLVRLIRRLILREAGDRWWLRVAGQVAFAGLWIYITFNILWGLNYDRLGIADQLQLTVKPYSTTELNALTGIIVRELNDLDNWSRMHHADLIHIRSLRGGAIRAYDSLALDDPQFVYKNPSVKSSLFSYPGVYMGFAGYYNPFTGEAQVNTEDPLFTQPYTTCHEMGHQLGYAKENEANFIGFLAARSSPDPAFRYSVYLDLFLYSARELFVRDSVLAKSFRDSLAPGVLEDLRELQRFNRKYANPIEPVIWRLYGRYLRANRQPQGIVTYSEVIAWLIAYGKKNGREALKGRSGGPRSPLHPVPGQVF